MKRRIYESKILYILISALICIQFGAYMVQLVNHRKIAEETLRDELTVGAQVFYRLLESRNAQLIQTAEILSRDYGFLEAMSMAHHDRATLESILENHGARAKASTLILSDLNNLIIAQTPSQPLITPQTQQTILKSVERDAHSVHFSTLQVMDNKNKIKPLFHVVKSAVKAPHHVANLLIGDEIDQTFVSDLRNVTNLDMFFVTHDNKQWTLHASTLPNAYAEAFTHQFKSADTNKIMQIVQHDDTYLMLPIPISQAEGYQTFAVIAKPLATMMQPYLRAEQVLTSLLVVTLVLSMIAVYYVTKKMVSPLSEQAHLDNLTGLGNRRLFNLELNRSLKQLKSTGKPFALFMLDLDKFKQVNDTMGHDMGDVVLRTVADRMKKTVRNTDNIMRLGGDEFAIILEDCSKANACMIAEKISHAIAEPIVSGDKSVTLYTSIGIALAKHPSDTIDSLMKKADEAMYVSKTKDVNFWIAPEKTTEKA